MLLLFSNVLTFTTPSVGATRTPSVSMERDVLTACSRANATPSLSFKEPANSFAIISAVDSLSFSSATSRILGAIPFGPTCASTLSARSFALGISASKEGSNPAFRALETRL